MLAHKICSSRYAKNRLWKSLEISMYIGTIKMRPNPKQTLSARKNPYLLESEREREREWERREKEKKTKKKVTRKRKEWGNSTAIETLSLSNRAAALHFQPGREKERGSASRRFGGCDVETLTTPSSHMQSLFIFIHPQRGRETSERD